MSLPSDDQLRRMALFRRLTSEDRARVAAVSRVVHHARGTSVFSEGEDADAFLAIVEGRVKVYKSTTAGKEIILEKNQHNNLNFTGSLQSLLHFLKSR